MLTVSLNPNLRAIIFRQKLTQHSDIVDKSHRLDRPMGGVYTSSTLTWTFPSGATLGRRTEITATYGETENILGSSASLIQVVD